MGFSSFLLPFRPPSFWMLDFVVDTHCSGKREIEKDCRGCSLFAGIYLYRLVHNFLTFDFPSIRSTQSACLPITLPSLLLTKLLQRGNISTHLHPSLRNPLRILLFATNTASDSKSNTINTTPNPSPPPTKCPQQQASPPRTAPLPSSPKGRPWKSTSRSPLCGTTVEARSNPKPART
jgi:hypothetical protein